MVKARFLNFIRILFGLFNTCCWITDDLFSMASKMVIELGMNGEIP